MSVPRWRRLTLLLGTALAVAAIGCRKKETAGVAELLTIRTDALAHLARGELPEAEEGFKKLVDLAPDDPLGHASLGLTYLQEGRYADAEPPLDRARKLDPKNPEVGLTLAKLYSLTNRRREARALLDELHRAEPQNAHVLYALAELDRGDGDPDAPRRYEQRLRELTTVAPANVAARVELVSAMTRRGAPADSVVQQLEEIRRIPPELPPEARALLDQSVQLLRAGNAADARAQVDRFVHVFEVTSPYQSSLDQVKWVEGPLVGRSVLTFAPKDFITIRSLRRRDSAAVVKFVDATADAGIPESGSAGAPTTPTALATGDIDGDGEDDLFVASPAGAHLYRVRGGQVGDVTARSKVTLPNGATFAAFADYDNDGWLDLFAIGGDGSGHLLRNRGAACTDRSECGTFEDVTAKAGVGDVRGARKALFVDVDHDGDLDLVLVGGPQLAVYRNNLDGTFTESAAALGLTGAPNGGASDAAFADFDGDGRVDLVVAQEKGLALFHNGGAQRFGDVAAASGLASAGGSAVAVGDYDNDGAIDLFLVGTSGATLWHNDGRGAFTRDDRASKALQALQALQALRGLTAAGAQFLDYDNDGRVDLVVTGTPRTAGGRAVYLFHNEGAAGFADRSATLPATVRAAAALAVVDVDSDGDEDVLVADGGGARLLRNVGGNGNLAVRVELKALRSGSGKNNDYGIGARVELRAGELYQTRVVTSRVTHFGLGPHLKADVLRIEWPNGVPQSIYFPGTDQDVLENEMLKGSCAFAYTWDGTRFRFVTDVMWRSALGMPLGLMGAGGASAFAPAGASQEYLRIPGEALRPKDGRYVMQLTEELWETAYADEVKLLAVDHPDSVDVFVDERFVPPGPVSLRLFQVAHPRLPLSAVDERGNDVLPALRASDDVYVSNMTPTRYQGVVEPHDLILDLGDEAGAPNTYLFLRGWIYPTDASINVALAQQSALRPAPPSLEVRDARGRWVTAIPSIGFPSGKDKTMVIDLAGKFPTRDHHVRLRTTMQIYWDQAFVSGDAAASPVQITTLSPLSADLHFRGYSRTYRKGGRYGPYWFAYDDVTKTSPWRPIEGAFTRFGDVLALVRQPDDMYVIMAPGDETTLQFDASSERALRPGWKRDFLLYTDGWIKDSDLNTAFGTTVGPLPFHKIKSYPYGPGDSYPADAAHKRYLEDYDTRVVRR